MTEHPADPVATEDCAYEAIVSMLRGYRRNGAGLLEAAALAAMHLVIINKAGEAE